MWRREASETWARFHPTQGIVQTQIVCFIQVFPLKTSSDVVSYSFSCIQYIWSYKCVTGWFKKQSESHVVEHQRETVTCWKANIATPNEGISIGNTFTSPTGFQWLVVSLPRCIKAVLQAQCLTQRLNPFLSIIALYAPANLRDDSDVLSSRWVITWL